LMNQRVIAVRKPVCYENNHTVIARW
jgi:hypothetical protein